MSTSHLSHAHDFNIGSLTINSQVAAAPTAIEHLHKNIAADAVHNSDERCSVPNCHPETRKVIQQEIHNWITDGDDDAEPKKIMWMTGPAGAGKTAIAGSIAEVCEDEGILAGSFFFSSFAGSEARRTKRFLIATLAYCLLQHDELQQLRAPILSAIERDRFIFRKSLSAQCKALILKPLSAVRLQLAQSTLPKVIVVDGLDEVEAANSRQLEPREARLANEAEQVEVLSALLQAVHNANFPFRILLVSRPEPVIRDFFSNRAGHLTKEVFLDDKYNPHSDISLFLKVKFGEIRRRYKLPISWPGEEVVEKLTDNASGQFVYAATVVRFLQTAGMHPQARLDCVLKANKAYTTTNGTVFSPLDALYTQITNSSPDPIESTIWMVAIWGLKPEPAHYARQFLQEYHGQAEYLLENLASLISVPAVEDQETPFEFYHKSLYDFWYDPQRCGPELHQAAVYSQSEFQERHYVHILIEKSPEICLPNSEWAAFLSSFLYNFAHQGRVWEERRSTWEDLLQTACDVPWWVRSVDATYTLDDSLEARSAMTYLFLAIHYFVCNESDRLDYGACRAICKRWRSDVINECKAIGWHVPNALALLRERMCREADQNKWSRKLDDVYNERYAFSPPDSWIPPGTPRNAPGDYESMCCLADSLYAHLPEDWPQLWKKEIDKGTSVSNALRLEFGRILGDMGVEIEDG